MSAYALVDSEGNITNIMSWDGKSDWLPPDGVTAVACPDGDCQIGGTYNDGVFSTPAAAILSSEELIALADNQKTALLSQANTYTQPWQTQLLLGIISDSDKASLTTWMKYYQDLQSVDTSTAPDITWPTQPNAVTSIT